MPSTTIPLSDIPLNRISGEPASLADFAGKVLLLVNVASKCGFTKQYEGLEALYGKYKDRNFEILGFPANDFGNQEPGSNADIQTFCSTSFGVTFPLFEKVAVTGEQIHPLYRSLIEIEPETTMGNPGLRAQLDGFLSKAGGHTNPAPGVLWNFEKFLIGKDGQVIGRFASDIAPDDPRLTNAIDAAL